MRAAGESTKRRCRASGVPSSLCAHLLGDLVRVTYHQLHVLCPRPRRRCKYMRFEKLGHFVPEAVRGQRATCCSSSAAATVPLVSGGA